MIHFQNNPNVFYFNSTDLTNNKLYIQDQSKYGFLGQKTIMYICQVVYSPDKQNESAYNNLQNTRYLAYQQQQIEKGVYKVKLLSQSSDDVKYITVSYNNKRNVFDLNEFVKSNYIQKNKIYSVLLRDLQLKQSSNENSQDVNTNLGTGVLTYSFSLDKLNQQHQLILTYSDLGVNQDVDIVIENSEGNVVNDNNFVSWQWENSYLTITFHDNNLQSDSVWNLKYIVNDDIRENIKSSTKQYNILLNGKQIIEKDYSVVYDGTTVIINHNSNNYIMGVLYNSKQKQIQIPINYKNMNQAWIDFENIPSTFDYVEEIGQYMPTQEKPYTFVMFVTKYYLSTTDDSLQVDLNGSQNIVDSSVVKIYEIDFSKLNNQNQLVLNYSDLGVNQNVDIVIENSEGNVVNNNNFVSWVWQNSYLTVTFHDSSILNSNDVWRIKYIVNDDIRENIKSSTRQYNILLNGKQIVEKDYTVLYETNNVVVNHNSNNYIMGVLYNSEQKQIYVPINYKNMNQAWIDFENIPSTFDYVEEIGQYMPTQEKPYTFVMFVTKYYLQFDKQNNQVEDNENNNEEVIQQGFDKFDSNVIKNQQEQYYPATKIKLNQLENERANFIIDKLLTPSIVQFRQIRIYNQQLVRLDDFTYKVTYQNLLNDCIQIFMNGAKIPLDKSQYAVDLFYGRIKFNFQTTRRDIFEMNYAFDYFPSHVLFGFLERSVSELNVSAVGTPTSYTFETAPQFYNGLIANFAYVLCLDKLILQYSLWKGRLVFALPPQALADGSGDIISQLQSLRSNAWQRISMALNNTKLKAPQYLSHPTALYYQGISPLGRYSGQSGRNFNGGKLRGLKINRYGGSF